MMTNFSLKSKKLLATLSFYLLWLILVALGVAVAFQLQVTLVYLGILVVENPALRPPGWNTSTISGINRCGYVIFGTLWLGLAIYLGKYLGDGLDEGRLGAYALRLGLILVGIYLFCAVLLYVLG